MPYLTRTRLTIAALAVFLAACGGTATAPLAQAAPDPATPPASSAQADGTEDPDGAVTFVVSSGSTATVRVREQLANVQAPNDAILRTTSVSGRFTLLPDGTFGDDSTLTVMLATLASDSGQRDSAIKRSTLQTDRYPSATFVPTAVSGLALPAAGDLAFTLTGDMTIHGVTKAVTFAVTGRASGSELTISATNAPSWKFADFGMSVPSSMIVLSVVDEIRLQIDLVAKAA